MSNAKFSVAINKTFIPFSSVKTAMQRFVHPAYFSTNDERWELRTFGTTFLCKYQDMDFAITSGHQVDHGGKKPLPETFVVLAPTEDGRVSIPPASILRPRIGEEKYNSLHDLCVFRFDDQLARHGITTLDLSAVRWPDDLGLTVDYSFLIGYPSDLFHADTDEEGAYLNVVNRWICLDISPTGPALMDMENRDMFVKLSGSKHLSTNPDGLSGSPVFSVVRDAASCCHIQFDGIVTHAGGDRFAVYPSIIIRRLLDKIIMEDQSKS